MILDHTYPPDQRVENEAESLVEAGHKVTVLSFADDDRARHDNYRGVDIFRVQIKSGLQKKLRGTVGFLDLYSNKIFNAVKELWNKTPFDAIHVHDLYLGRVGIKAKREFQRPLIIDLHENYVHALTQYAWSTRFPGNILVSIPKWEKLERDWIEQADGVITVIGEMKDRYLKQGFPDEKFIVTPNTPKISTFREFEFKEEILNKYEGKKVLLYSGGFDLHRGLETAVAAMPEVLKINPDAMLVLVGTGRNHNELISQVADLGLTGNVVFEGWQPQENIRSFVKRADVGLIPHVKSVQTDASIPHKLGYYMSEELPVITSNCTSLERMVKEHHAGLVFESENPQDLANKINEILNSETVAKKLGENGKKAAEKTFNWDSTIQPLINFYANL